MSWQSRSIPLLHTSAFGWLPSQRVRWGMALVTKLNAEGRPREAVAVMPINQRLENSVLAVSRAIVAVGLRAPGDVLTERKAPEGPPAHFDIHGLTPIRAQLVSVYGCAPNSIESLGGVNTYFGRHATRVFVPYRAATHQARARAVAAWLIMRFVTSSRPLSIQEGATKEAP